MRMRELFRSYYPPSSAEISSIWEEGIFSLDANVLLNIYRYSPKTRARFFEILEKLGNRVWITHQAAYEYQENRLKVISDQANAYKAIHEHLDKVLGLAVIKFLKDNLDQFSRHSYIDVHEITAIVERGLKNTFTKAQKHLKQAQAEQADLISDDDLRERLTDLLGDRIGEGYESERLEELYVEGERRFTAKIPPGFKDEKKKDGSQKYGDFILWSQLLELAATKTKPLIFITDDAKEDWWLIHQGRTISPRRELIDEMYKSAGVSFLMYKSSGFMAHAKDFLQLSDERGIIEEAEQISLSNEIDQVAKTEIQSKQELATSRSSRRPTSLQEAFAVSPEMRLGSAIQDYLQRDDGLMSAINSTSLIDPNFTELGSKLRYGVIDSILKTQIPHLNEGIVGAMQGIDKLSNLELGGIASQLQKFENVGFWEVASRPRISAAIEQAAKLPNTGNQSGILGAIGQAARPSSDDERDDDPQADPEADDSVNHES